MTRVEQVKSSKDKIPFVSSFILDNRYLHTCFSLIYRVLSLSWEEDFLCSLSLSWLNECHPTSVYSTLTSDSRTRTHFTSKLQILVLNDEQKSNIAMSFFSELDCLPDHVNHRPILPIRGFSQRDALFSRRFCLLCLCIRYDGLKSFSGQTSTFCWSQVYASVRHLVQRMV